jgi:hypothetical protein
METDDLDPSDLTARIEEARHVAADAPDAKSLHDLGVLLLTSYECYGGPAVVAEALGVLRQAVEVSLAAGTGWNGPRGVLGTALVAQHEIDGDPATLDAAIDLLSAVVRETPRDPVSGTDYRIELGVALEARVWETGSEQDADAAVALARTPAPRILRNEAATRDAVRAGLARHPWFHFAGHSRQDLLHPARAGLCLGDGDLSALAIATQRLAGGELRHHRPAARTSPQPHSPPQSRLLSLRTGQPGAQCRHAVCR